MIRTLLTLLVCLVASGTALAQATKAKDATKKVQAVFEPAEAKPGQTVTLKITVELAEGYHTYPVVQPASEAKYSVNAITFPKDGPVIFVGETVDPVEPKAKKVDDYELLTYPGGGTWIRRAVVLPSAKAGPTTAKVKFKLLVCDENNCFPPKTHDLEATIKVLDGPPVPVDSKYKDEIEKAAKK
jgi:DsbC/DsbD-like thiol-disulfide interchange protein